MVEDKDNIHESALLLIKNIKYEYVIIFFCYFIINLIYISYILIYC